MSEQQERLTAMKVRISDINNAEFIKPEGEWTPSYILVKSKKVSRINIIATVISRQDSEDNSYSSLVLDDGSDSIQTKSWKDEVKMLKNVEIGDLVLVIGKIRNYNNQNYLSLEIVKRLDNLLWLELRKKELNKIYGSLVDAQANNQKKEKFSSEERQKILTLVKELNADDGADINEVISKSQLKENAANKLIQELLKEGEIFEIRPGGLKIIS